ncbi:MAG TPA: hypothetical protein PKA42_00420 [Candidatus Paceibacterota bacterium]|nr:hypothetical protein [Candidatus Paceibacterota bacterium]HMO82609.1 hypothetical protein [Candidatus Paceibacterota bacterium]
MRKSRGEIVAVKDLFVKYRQTLQAPQKSVEVEAIKAIGEVLGIRLGEDQVAYTVSSQTLHIKASGMFKQEIKIKEQEIIKNLKQALGTKSSPKTIL